MEKVTLGLQVDSRGALIKLTKPVRHYIAKCLTPKHYSRETWSEAHMHVPRPMIQEARRRFGAMQLKGVEIGVAEGLNAESILKALNMKSLYLVDPYQPYYRKDTLVIHHVKEEQQMKGRLENALASGQVIHLKCPSSEAVSFVPDDLDFVYIDGNHDYEHVYADLQAYWNKVRLGGIIGGHDFYIRDYIDLIKAVIDFSRLYDLEIHGDYTDYWIVKE